MSDKFADYRSTHKNLTPSQWQWKGWALEQLVYEALTSVSLGNTAGSLSAPESTAAWHVKK